jgi:hypothetical protein
LAAQAQAALHPPGGHRPVRGQVPAVPAPRGLVPPGHGPVAGQAAPAPAGGPPPRPVVVEISDDDD